MVLNPKEAGEFIASNASYVKINEKAVEKLGNLLLIQLEKGRLKPPNFSQAQFHPKPSDFHAVDWILVVNTLNFCFWDTKSGKEWQVEGFKGYYALCAALNRALKERVDIFNPAFYSTITHDQLKEILRSDNQIEIPLLNERVNCLREVGTVLLEKFDGTFKTCVERAGKSAVKLLEIIIDNFNCFRDEAEFKNTKVAIYKRAQILISDIWKCFQNEELGKFNDIDKITMFAEYRVPQTLLLFGVLEYSDELMEILRENVILENGSEEEVEIRGCSIHAIELLKEYIRRKSKGADVNSVLIDHFLWDYRRNNAKKIKAKGLPFHRTCSIYY